MPQADRRTDAIRADLRALLDELFPLGRDEEPNAADLAQGAEWWARTCIWWAARCREAWASRDGLSTEVAALRAENERLLALGTIAQQLHRIEQSVLDSAEVVAAREARAELAAERAQHETTRAAVETTLDALGDVRVYGECNSTYYCGAQTMAKRVRAALAAAASPQQRPACSSAYMGVTCEWGAGHPSGTDANGHRADHGAPSRNVWWTTSVAAAASPHPVAEHRCATDKTQCHHIGAPSPVAGQEAGT